MKYFNSIKNISHIIGFGYFDRTVEKQEVGEANAVTKKKKTRNAVLDETRKIKFRDDSMIADAKSRFANIIDEIILDTDEFIKAITDAINSASGDEVSDVKPTTKKKTTKKAEPVVEEPVEVVEETVADEVPFDIDEVEDVMITLDTDRLTAIRAAFKAADAGTKAEVKKHLADYGNKLSDTMKSSDVNAIENILGINDEL
jgi:lipoate-protein ligase A